MCFMALCLQRRADGLLDQSHKHRGRLLYHWLQPDLLLLDALHQELPDATHQGAR